MNVLEAVASRRSCRAYLDRPVSGEIIRELLRTAALAPSGGNLQPWHVHVLANDALRDFLAVIEAEAAHSPRGGTAEYTVYPPDLWDPYRARRYQCAEDLYAAIGIPREDKPARLRQLRRNLQFFGAPVALLISIDRRFDGGQWADLGMFLQTLMLAARALGLATCAQESWAAWHVTVSRYLSYPRERQLFCGMALGYPDDTAAINGFRTARAQLDEFATFSGI